MTINTHTPDAPAHTFLNVRELATYLKISERTVRRMISEKKIPYKKVSNLIRFEQEDVNTFIDSCRVEAIAR